MKPEEVKYKMFHLDEAINKLQKKDKEDMNQKRLPRVYKVKPDEIKGETVDETNESLKNKIKKEISKRKL
ncbi:MAG: hypothetical protein IPM51_12255 [Sphingobacteriaceae bacterium]|nr:hypothetical protein [Sphingobacteriaceae bacterium]